MLKKLKIRGGGEKNMMGKSRNKYEDACICKNRDKEFTFMALSQVF